MSSDNQVQKVLNRITEEKALYIGHHVMYSGDYVVQNYLIRENDEIIHLSEKPGHWEGWNKVLYSNLTAQYESWIRQIVDGLKNREMCFVDREEVPETGYGCIFKYCRGDESFKCRKCGTEFEGGKDFAIHAWNDHGITEDPRSYRDPKIGQMSLGGRWA